MISQKCPKCYSKRVRRGYRPTPLWSKILFRYNLLCDSCNWEFTGFAVPGTVSSKPTKSGKKRTTGKLNQILIHKTSEEEIDSFKDKPEVGGLKDELEVNSFKDESETVKKAETSEAVVSLDNSAKRKVGARKKAKAK